MYTHTCTLRGRGVPPPGFGMQAAGVERLRPRAAGPATCTQLRRVQLCVRRGKLHKVGAAVSCGRGRVLRSI